MGQSYQIKQYPTILSSSNPKSLKSNKSDPLQQYFADMPFKFWLALLSLLLLCHSADPHLERHILPVYGNASLGYYYVNLYIGTPPQQQSVIIDTGSGQLALPCSECVSCGSLHIQRPLDIRKSSTNKIVTCNSGHQLCKESCQNNQPKPCTFVISYAEGSSLSGILIQDAIEFENEPGEAITTTFGCTIKETNLFYTQAANGIFGLAPKRKAKLLELLYERHSKFTGEELLFSICLSKNGGQLAIGKISKELVQGINPVKTTFNPYRNLYSLNNVGSIKINNTVIRESQDMGYYGIFIDSGSTFTYFRNRQYNILLQEIQNVCAFHSDICKKAKKTGAICLRIDFPSNQTIKDVLINMFPSIDIEINGNIVSWLPHRYFLLRNNRNSNEICLGIESLDRFLLGGNWMVDRNIVFNLKEESVQIFSDVQCGGPTQSQDVPIYYDNNSGTFTYIAAAFHVNEDLVARVLVFALIAILMIVVLLMIGAYCFNRQGRKKEAKDVESKELTEDVDSTIVFASNQNSSRGLEEHSEENVGEANGNREEDVEVETL